MTKYEIRYSKARERKGLNPWAVFEIVDPTFSKGLSDHATEAEAKAALARLKENQ